MFFGYPIVATAENWLHECLCEVVTAIHAGIDAGAQPAAWPAIIPAAHRARLRWRTGLRGRLATYTLAAQAFDSGSEHSSVNLPNSTKRHR